MPDYWDELQTHSTKTTPLTIIALILHAAGMLASASAARTCALQILGTGLINRMLGEAELGSIAFKVLKFTGQERESRKYMNDRKKKKTIREV